MATDRDATIDAAALTMRRAIESLDAGNPVDALFLLEEAADHLRQVVRHPSRPMSRWESGETVEEEPSAVAAILWGLRPLWL